MKLWSLPEFFHKNMSHEQLPFMLSNYVILAWVQSWNIFEKLMKVCSPPEFFHKNMSHERLPLTWSTFRDSSMTTKLKYFLKTYKSVYIVFLHFLRPPATFCLGYASRHAFLAVFFRIRFIYCRQDDCRLT